MMLSFGVATHVLSYQLRRLALDYCSLRTTRLTLPLRPYADEMGLGKTAQLICFLGAPSAT